MSKSQLPHHSDRVTASINVTAAGTPFKTLCRRMCGQRQLAVGRFKAGIGSPELAGPLFHVNVELLGKCFLQVNVRTGTDVAGDFP
jgi:hypothetical protein